MSGGAESSGQIKIRSNGMELIIMQRISCSTFRQLFSYSVNHGVLCLNMLELPKEYYSNTGDSFIFVETELKHWAK